MPFPSPEELPNPGIEPWFPAWQADSLPFELQGSPCKGSRLSYREVLCSRTHLFPLFVLEVLEFLWWLSQEKICLQCRRTGFDSWVGKISWRREWLPTPVFLPGEFHGQRSLAGYSPWGHKESDTTEQRTLINDINSSNTLAT